MPIKLYGKNFPDAYFFGVPSKIGSPLIEHCALNFDCVLTLQSLSEFYAAATRKGKVTHDQAEAQIKDWHNFLPVFFEQVFVQGNGNAQ